MAELWQQQKSSSVVKESTVSHNPTAMYFLFYPVIILVYNGTQANSLSYWKHVNSEEQWSF